MTSATLCPDADMWQPLRHSWPGLIGDFRTREAMAILKFVPAPLSLLCLLWSSIRHGAHVRVWCGGGSHKGGSRYWGLSPACPLVCPDLHRIPACHRVRCGRVIWLLSTCLTEATRSCTVLSGQSWWPGVDHTTGQPSAEHSVLNRPDFGTPQPQLELIAGPSKVSTSHQAVSRQHSMLSEMRL